VHMCWPESDKVLRAISDEKEGAASGSAGRGKVAPYFRADLEALGGAAMSRIVRAVADKRAVRSVEVGVREFQEEFGLQQAGAM